MRFLNFIVVLLLYFTFIQAQTGREIMEKVDQQNKYKTMIARSKLTLVNKRGQKRERIIRRFEKDISNGNIDKKTLVVFEYPNDVRGTSLLIYSYNDPSKDDDRWLYLPALRKVRRIAGRSKSEYFMGTDFTYDDLGGRTLDKDRFKFIGSDKIDNTEYLKIEATPVEKEPTYSKRIIWVLSGKWVIKRIDFFGVNGVLIKRMECDSLKNIDGRWIFTLLHMKNIKKNHQTIIKLNSVSYDKPLDDDLFTVNMIESQRILLLEK